MKDFKLLILLFFLTGTFQGSISCKKDTICITIQCYRGTQNQETCKCDCPEGFSGEYCQNDEEIQALINSGLSPKEIFDKGIPLERIYGNIYLGGLIFYLDTINGKGIVAAMEDQSNRAKWGCEGLDISDLKNNTIFPPPYPDTQEGSKIGEGKANTDAILAACQTDDIAARLCRNLGPDWFLPSRGELNLMFTNLKKNGHGHFMDDYYYWSSTEYNDFNAWIQHFKGGFQVGHGKFNDVRVRAALAF